MNRTAAKKLLSAERDRLERLREGVFADLGDPSDELASLAETSGADQHPADVGTERFEREKDISIIVNIDAELVEVRSALRRLDTGGYGTCELCGRYIGEDRLRARPAARFCVTDQAVVERQVRAVS
ncbi:MAG TPA: TraR/DksA C4-type zinc finger protein [Actinomycetota bacterium]|jgi:RNA polymerase-binding transcription factor DksA